MKVWVVGRNYPLPDNNMQGSFELEQAKMLAKHGYEVCYLACSLHPTKVIGDRGYCLWEEDNVQILTYSSFFLPRVLPLYMNSIRSKFWLRLFHKAEENFGTPNVIHVHYPAMLMLADALRLYHDKGVRIVATEHWTKVLKGKLDKVELKQYKLFSRICDVLICVSYPLAQRVKQLIECEPVVVPNVVNAVFAPSIDKFDSYTFVCAGRLTRVKQVDIVIRQFAHCFREQSNVRLMIIGGGPEENSLSALIDELDIRSQIDMVGSMTREKTAELVSRAHCLVCFSNLETFGVPIIEAWACGIPAVVSKAAPVVNSFDKRLGIEVSPDCPEELGTAMQHMYQNQERFDAQFLVDFAQKNYSEETIIRVLRVLYESE